MSMGEQLRTAREARGVSVSVAAAATRMKVQHIEALERDDFDRFAAPIYAQGFIRLYAEYLGLDAAPLLREYAERSHPNPPAPPAEAARRRVFAPSVAKPRRAPEAKAPSTLAAPPPATRAVRVWRPAWSLPTRRVALIAGVAALAIVALVVIIRGAPGSSGAADRKRSPPPTTAWTESASPPVIEDPPEPLLLELIPPHPGGRPGTAP